MTNSGFIPFPKRIVELWPWFLSVYIWDWGDPEPLAKCIRTEPIPDEFREALSDIVAGTRKRQKNYGKSRIPAQYRLLVVIYVSGHSGMRDHFLGKSGEIADRLGIEPIEVVRRSQKTVLSKYEEAANGFGVSVETIKNMRREVKARIDRWPVV